MRRPVPIALIASFAVGLVLAAGMRSRTRNQRPADEVTLKPDSRLLRRTGPCEFNGATLNDALDELSRRTQTTIHLHRDEAAQRLIDPSVPEIHLGFGDEPLGKALQLVLATMKEFSDPLVAWERDGIVHIGLQRPADTSIRVYDLQPLIARLPPVDELEESTPPTPPPNALPAAPPNPPSAGGMFGSSLPLHVEARIEALNVLKRRITELVDPQTWQEVGGSAGTIHQYGALLVIEQTNAAHARIDRLLGLLSRPANVGGPIPPLHSGVGLNP